MAFKGWPESATGQSMDLPLRALESGAEGERLLPGDVLEEFGREIQGELDRAYCGPPNAGRFLPLLDLLLTRHLRESGPAGLEESWAAEFVAEIEQTIDRACESGPVVRVATEYSFVRAALRMRVEARMRLHGCAPVVYPQPDVARPWPLLYYLLQEEEEGEVYERSDFEAEFGPEPGESLPSVEAILRRFPGLASREVAAFVDCSALAERLDPRLESSLLEHLERATGGERHSWRLVLLTEDSSPCTDSRLARLLDWLPACRFVPARLAWWFRLSEELQTIAAQALLEAAPRVSIHCGDTERRTWAPSTSERILIGSVLQLVDPETGQDPSELGQGALFPGTHAHGTVEDSREDCAAHFRSVLAWLAGLNHRDAPPLATRLKRYESSLSCLSAWERQALALDRQHVVYQLSDASCDQVRLSANVLLAEVCTTDELVQRLEQPPHPGGQRHEDSRLSDLQVLAVESGASLQLQRLGPRTAQFLSRGDLLEHSLEDDERGFYGASLDRGQVLAWLRTLAPPTGKEPAGAWPGLRRIAEKLSPQTAVRQWQQVAKQEGVGLPAESTESSTQIQVGLACLRLVGSCSARSVAGFVSVTRDRMRDVELAGLQDGFNQLEGMLKFLMIALARLVPTQSFAIEQAFRPPFHREPASDRPPGRRSPLAAGVDVVADRVKGHLPLGTLVEVLRRVTSNRQFGESLGVGNVANHLLPAAAPRNGIAHFRLDSEKHKDEALKFQLTLGQSEEFWKQLPLHAVVEAEVTTEWGSQLTFRTELEDVVTVPMHLLGGRPHDRGSLLGARLLVARGPTRGPRSELWWAPVATEWPSTLLQRARLELKEDV